MFFLISSENRTNLSNQKRFFRSDFVYFINSKRQFLSVIQNEKKTSFHLWASIYSRVTNNHLLRNISMVIFCYYFSNEPSSRDQRSSAARPAMSIQFSQSPNAESMSLVSALAYSKILSIQVSQAALKPLNSTESHRVSDYLLIN